MADSVAIARQILQVKEDPFKALSLAPDMPPVSLETPIAEARLHYMRLAALIHPDKIEKTFDKATEAFQTLVRLFEHFVDPRFRKKAAAEAKKKQTVAAKKKTPSDAVVDTVDEKKKKKITSKERKPSSSSTAKTKSKIKRKDVLEESESDMGSEDLISDSEEEEEDEEGDAEEDEEEDFLIPNRGEPIVSTNRSPIGVPRIGGDYKQTTIGCPRCKTLWQPDSRPQYSLFMGPTGMKVHCQLCLLCFGSATALHECPMCNAHFDYDCSMYDEMKKCQRCKGTFGFPYYPINQMLIDQIRLKEWKEQKERENAAEREARAARRKGRSDQEGDNNVDQIQLWIGSCVMDEECPLCHKRVRSHHRSHVEECARRSTEGKAAITEKVKSSTADSKNDDASEGIVGATKAAPKAGTRAKKTTRAPAKESKTTPPKKKQKTAPKSRQRRSYSSSESEESFVSDESSDFDESD